MSLATTRSPARPRQSHRSDSPALAYRNLRRRVRETLRKRYGKASARDVDKAIERSWWCISDAVWRHFLADSARRDPPVSPETDLPSSDDDECDCPECRASEET